MIYFFICMIFIIIDIVIMDMIDMAKEIDGQEPGTGPDQRARGLWKTAVDDFLALDETWPKDE